MFSHTVYGRNERKTVTLESSPVAISAIETSTSGNDNCSQSIPKDVPEYAEVGLQKVSANETIPSGYVNINATEGLPSNVSDPRYHNISCNTPRDMFLSSDNKPSQEYTPLDEASIQKQGEYSSLK